MICGIKKKHPGRFGSLKKEYIFWKKKKVLITGHTGFKGSWLALWLSYLGARVYGFSTFPDYEPLAYDNLLIKKSLTKEYIGDIRDFSKLKNFIKKYEPEIIFHLAAQPLVRKSYSNPIETLETNIIGTANLLEASRNIKNLKTIVVVTTDKCYENIEKKNYSYSEDDRLGGHDIYSASKASTEIITASFRKSYQKNFKNCVISTARAGNVIGGGDWSGDRLIPDIIKSIIHKKILKIRYPNAIRPWQHVLEPLGGYMRLAYMSYQFKNKNLSTSWNFGPSKSSCISVKEVLSLFKKKFKNKLIYKIPKKKHLHEANYLRLDIKKVKKNLNWKPKWDVKKAINFTYDWYDQLNIKNIKKLRDISLDQIKDYMKN